MPTPWNLPSRGTFSGGSHANPGNTDFGRWDYRDILRTAGAGFNRQNLMDAQASLQAFRGDPNRPNITIGSAANDLISGNTSAYVASTGRAGINLRDPQTNNFSSDFTQDDYRHALATGQTHRQVLDWLDRNPTRVGNNPITSTVRSNVDRVARDQAAAQQNAAVAGITAQRDQLSTANTGLQNQLSNTQGQLGNTQGQLNTASTNLANVTNQLGTTQNALTISQRDLASALDTRNRITRSAPQRVSGATSATSIAAPRATTTRQGGFRGTLAGLTRGAPTSGPNQLRINTLNI